MLTKLTTDDYPNAHHNFVLTAVVFLESGCIYLHEIAPPFVCVCQGPYTRQQNVLKMVFLCVIKKCSIHTTMF